MQAKAKWVWVIAGAGSLWAGVLLVLGLLVPWLGAQPLPGQVLLWGGLWAVGTAAAREAANAAERQALSATPQVSDPLLAPHYPAIPGQNLRGLGWDIDTALSRPRGARFPIGSFGQGGFTGTTLWIDPGSDTYVVVLSNVIHQRGGPPVVTLSGEVATESARALGLYGS